MADNKKNNIVLIGMPGCGKSTVGVVLAKAMGYGFVDSDLVIQAKEQRLLSDIIEEEGLEGFNQIEEKVNSELEAFRSIIATGGSVIYGPKAMAHLKEIGLVVYLKLSLPAVTERLGDLTARGVSIKEGWTLADLYAERVPLYEKYADLTIDTEALALREVVKKIIEEKKKIEEKESLDGNITERKS